jgi:hypothetical protein
MSNVDTDITRAAYSVASMASAYEVSEQQIRNEIKAGRLAAKYTGRRQLIDPSEAKRWFDALPSERV